MYKKVETTYHEVENKNKSVCPEFAFDNTYFWCILKPIISIVKDNNVSEEVVSLSLYDISMNILTFGAYLLFVSLIAVIYTDIIIIGRRIRDA
mgnify:CR=1 FL=1|jgi:hypothetical protein